MRYWSFLINVDLSVLQGGARPCGTSIGRPLARPLDETAAFADPVCRRTRLLVNCCALTEVHDRAGVSSMLLRDRGKAPVEPGTLRKLNSGVRNTPVRQVATVAVNALAAAAVFLLSLSFGPGTSGAEAFNVLPRWSPERRDVSFTVTRRSGDAVSFYAVKGNENTSGVLRVWAGVGYGYFYYVLYAAPIDKDGVVRVARLEWALPRYLGLDELVQIPEAAAIVDLNGFTGSSWALPRLMGESVPWTNLPIGKSLPWPLDGEIGRQPEGPNNEQASRMIERLAPNAYRIVRIYRLGLEQVDRKDSPGFDGELLVRDGGRIVGEAKIVDGTLISRWVESDQPFKSPTVEPKDAQSGWRTERQDFAWGSESYGLIRYNLTRSREVVAVVTTANARDIPRTELLRTVGLRVKGSGQVKSLRLGEMKPTPLGWVHERDPRKAVEVEAGHPWRIEAIDLDESRPGKSQLTLTVSPRSWTVEHICGRASADDPLPPLPQDRLVSFVPSFTDPYDLELDGSGRRTSSVALADLDASLATLKLDAASAKHWKQAPPAMMRDPNNPAGLIIESRLTPVTWRIKPRLEGGPTHGDLLEHVLIDIDRNTAIGDSFKTPEMVLSRLESIGFPWWRSKARLALAANSTAEPVSRQELLRPADLGSVPVTVAVRPAVLRVAVAGEIFGRNDRRFYQADLASSAVNFAGWTLPLGGFRAESPGGIVRPIDYLQFESSAELGAERASLGSQTLTQDGSELALESGKPQGGKPGVYKITAQPVPIPLQLGLHNPPPVAVDLELANEARERFRVEQERQSVGRVDLPIGFVRGKLVAGQTALICRGNPAPTLHVVSAEIKDGASGPRLSAQGYRIVSPSTLVMVASDNLMQNERCFHLAKDSVVGALASGIAARKGDAVLPNFSSMALSLTVGSMNTADGRWLNGGIDEIDGNAVTGSLAELPTRASTFLANTNPSKTINLNVVLSAARAHFRARPADEQAARIILIVNQVPPDCLLSSEIVDWLRAPGTARRLTLFYLDAGLGSPPGEVTFVDRNQPDVVQRLPWTELAEVKVINDVRGARQRALETLIQALTPRLIYRGQAATATSGFGISRPSDPPE
jgi:hypothetical protein